MKLCCFIKIQLNLIVYNKHGSEPFNKQLTTVKFISYMKLTITVHCSFFI